MKKNSITYLLAAFAAIVLYNNTHAQLSIRTSIGATSDLVTVNNVSAGVTNLFVIDSLGQTEPGQVRDYQSPILHLATFEIDLGSNGKNILKTLYSAMQGQQAPNLTLNKVNSDGKILENRDYSSITVKEIILPEFKADSREIAKAKVTIQAQNVYNNSGGKGMSAKFDKGARGATANLIRLNMDDFPETRAVGISNIKIVPSSAAGYLYFNIVIPSEETRQWNDWLNANARQNAQTRNATINFLDETLKEIFSIQLSQVEIVSISSQSNSTISSPGHSTGIPKITIGLRTNQNPVLD